ncbi:hypothetical protein ACC691_41365, partial [Rhizobium johnstonii]|uniref:hypothetical protein n=1 Tax=Rhizobium johnstonii TaxID=3019933 RepID=UPI003F96A5E4
ATFALLARGDVLDDRDTGLVEPGGDEPVRPSVAAGAVEHAVEQMAMFLQARDAREFGVEINGVHHPLWVELGPIGTE